MIETTHAITNRKLLCQVMRQNMNLLVVKSFQALKNLQIFKKTKPLYKL